MIITRDKSLGAGHGVIMRYTLPKRILDALKGGELTNRAVDMIIKHGDLAQEGIIRHEDIYSENTWTTAGWTELLSIITGASTNVFDASYARIGVGNSSTAAAATQTALLGTSQSFSSMESGYPTTPSSGTVQFKGLFTTTMGNFEWLEWGVKNSASGVLWNRSVSFSSTPGTKTTSDYWYLLATLGAA